MANFWSVQEIVPHQLSDVPFIEIFFGLTCSTYGRFHVCSYLHAEVLYYALCLAIRTKFIGKFTDMQLHCEEKSVRAYEDASHFLCKDIGQSEFLHISAAKQSLCSAHKKKLRIYVW